MVSGGWSNGSGWQQTTQNSCSPLTLGALNHASNASSVPSVWDYNYCTLLLSNPILKNAQISGYIRQGDHDPQQATVHNICGYAGYGVEVLEPALLVEIFLSIRYWIHKSALCAHILHEFVVLLEAKPSAKPQRSAIYGV